MNLVLNTQEICHILAQYAVNKLGKPEYNYSPHINIKGLGDIITATIVLGEPTGKREP